MWAASDVSLPVTRQGSVRMKARWPGLWFRGSFMSLSFVRGAVGRKLRHRPLFKLARLEVEFVLQDPEEAGLHPLEPNLVHALEVEALIGDHLDVSDVGLLGDLIEDPQDAGLDGGEAVLLTPRGPQ